MVVERVEFLIKDGMADQMLNVLRTRALPLTETYTGCISFKALQGIENPNKIMLFAEWDSVEAHLASRAEPAHVQFRDLLVPYSAGMSSLTEHFVQI